MKKFCLALLMLCMLFSCAIGFAACANGIGHKHDLTYREQTDATCTMNGNKEYWYCPECGRYFADAQGKQEIGQNDWLIPALAHRDMQHFAPADATCTANGNSEYWYCPDCGKYFADVIGTEEITKDDWLLPALAHRDMQHFAPADATCTANGNSEYWYCPDCGKHFADANGEEEIASGSWILPALAHRDMQYFERVDATCTADGNSEYWFCPDCGKYFADVQGEKEIAKDSWMFPALAHRDMRHFAPADATCTADGNSEYWYCPLCKKFFADANGEEEIAKDSWVLPALAHRDIQHFAPAEATCTADGNSEYWYCPDCNKYFADANGEEEIAKDSWVLPTLAHRDIQHFTPVEATCTADGNSEYWYCPDCDKYFADAKGEEEIAKDSWVLPALAHRDMQHFAPAEATCTADGNSEYWFCPDCNKYFADAQAEREIEKEDWLLPALAHRDMQHFERADATCTADGNSEYWYCPDCDKYFADANGEKEIAKDSWVLPALAHRDMQHFDPEEATCTADGNKEYWYCPDCNKYFADAQAEREIEREDWLLPAHHTYTEEWTYDEFYHWHAATCEHSDEISEKTAHTFVDRVCTVCGCKTEYTPGLEYALSQDGNSYEVIGIGSVTDREIIIPAIHLDLPVTAIGTRAFLNCDISTVTIPDSVTNIGRYAFQSCHALTSVAVGRGVKNIDSYAFDDCTSLEGISLPYGATTIENNAFSGCSSLAYIVLPETIVSLDFNAFNGCTALENAVVPVTLTGFIPDANLKTLVITGSGELYTRAFYQCDSLQSVTIGDGVSVIGAEAFRDCTSLTNVTIGNGVQEIKSNAFNNCISLTDVTLGSGVTAIGASAFDSCGSLRSIVLGDSVETIGAKAFSSCGSLTDVTFGNSVTSIGEYAFNGCRLLEDIEIPHSLSIIESNVFRSCASLTEVVLPDNLTEIGSQAFSYCSSLISITIPNSIKSIGSNAFYGCSRLEKVMITDIAAWCTIDFANNAANPLCYADCLYVNGQVISELVVPDSVTKISDYAFYTYAPLTRVVTGNGVTSIGVSSFEGCRALRSVVIGDNVTTIGSNAFTHCTCLMNVVLGKSVRDIRDFAFSNCVRLVEIYNLSSLNIQIGYEKFNGLEDYALNISTTEEDKGIFTETDDGYIFYETGEKIYLIGYIGNETELTLPDTLNGKEYDLNKKVFYGCDQLTSIIIPDCVPNIENNAFERCSSLVSVSIPDSVKFIGNSAFSECGSLTNVVIPNSVELIDSSVFNGCSSLTSIAIPDSVELIGSSVFSGCSSLETVTIGNGVANLYDSTFMECPALKSIEVDKDNAFYCSEDGVLFNKDKTVLISYPAARPGNSYIVPDSVKSIGNYAFMDNTKIESITLPNGLTDIGEESFYNCTLLGSIVLPDSVTSVASKAFYSCSAMKSVVIGQNVGKIGDSAFRNCFKLTEVYNFSALPLLKGSNDYGMVAYNALYVYTSGEEERKLTTTEDGYIFFEDGETVYLTGYSGTKTELTLPDTFNGKKYAIRQYAFYDCRSIVSISIPDGVTSIGVSAFRGCTSLERVYITSISAWCAISFENEYANPLSQAGRLYLNGKLVTNLVLPDSVTSIPNYCFNNCTSLVSITLGSGITSIGTSAFEGCVRLIEIYNFSSLPLKIDSLNYGYIAQYALYIYKSAEEQSKLVTDRDGYVFCVDAGFVRLVAYEGEETSLVLPDSFNGERYEIYNNAFYANRQLVKVVIPKGVTIIGDFAFYDCSSLKDVILAEGVTGICSFSFGGCTSLTNIVLPDSLTEFWGSAFSNCSSLTSITIPACVTSLDDYTFSGCSSLTTITIPASITSIGISCFASCGSLAHINYDGTIANWNAIVKYDYWDDNTGNYTVHCTDGDFAQM